jgi:hypothetical protein
MAEWLAGYFLVLPKPFAKHEPLVTVSDCLHDVVPGLWCFPWAVETDVPTPDRPAEPLLTEARDFFAAEFEANRFGWPYVFMSVELAREAARRFMPLPGLRLLGVVVDDVGRHRLMDALQPNGPKEGECGTFVAVKDPRPIEPGRVLGYEALGAEVGGSFHTAWCHGVPSEWVGFAPKLTPEGLFAERDECVRVADDCHFQRLGAEPCAWVAAELRSYPLS